MGPHPGPNSRAASRRGALLYFKNKKEAVAPSELCFSSPLEMGGMVLWLDQDTLFQPFCVSRARDPPADKVLGMRVPPQGTPQAEQQVPFIGPTPGLGILPRVTSILLTAPVTEEPGAQRG